MNKPQSSQPSEPLTGTMSLDEARSVLWLRNHRRPLGELLDEGFLTQDRLEWAAAKAYDSRLRQAAAVLLKGMERSAMPAASRRPESLPPIEPGMTIEQARAVLWPLKPYQGQSMGNLVDARQVGCRDLGYAIENAWDERVRHAAIVLMAVRLNQAIKEPKPLVGPLAVVSGGQSYSEAKQFAWTFVQGMFLGALGVLAILLLIWGIGSLAWFPSGLDIGRFLSPVGIIVLIIFTAVTIGAMWLLNRLLDLTFNRIDNQIENYRQGQDGEDRVVEVLRQSLDGNWTLFRNVVLPGRNKADIDGVLVGPPGVWALEVKALTGEYRNIGEHWEYLAGRRWKLLKKSPSRQAQDNAARLSSFLKADGIKQWVAPVVVWANRDSPLSVENPMAAVWTMDRLPEELANVWQGQTIHEPDRTRIVDKLTALCQSENDEEAN